jgi:5-hydroxyisourate hydrolase-like protein (transthyretin family)
MMGEMTAFLKRWMALLALGFLAACGGGGGAGTAPFGGTSGGGSTGGGGSSGGGVTPPAVMGAPTVVVSISRTTITSSAPATVTATVRNASGEPAAGQVVSFSTASTAIGRFEPASALTNAAGVASVQLTPLSPAAAGADLAIATSLFGTDEVRGTVGFQVQASSTTPGGLPSISIALSNTAVTTAAPATISSVLRDASGAPLAGQVVKFSTVDGLGTFNVPSALTDANGSVTARLSPATTSTNGADLAVVQAVVNGAQVTGTAGFSVTSTNAPVVGVPSIALSLSTSVVTGSTPAIVTATVRDATGAGVAGQVVRFSTVDGLGSFAVQSALTDASGRASVTLTASAAGSSGADQVVAATTVNDTSLQATQGFQLTAPNVTIAAFNTDLGGATLSAYGQTNLLVSVSGVAAGSPVQVNLSSTCVARGKATLTPTSATTTTGSTSFTYRDAGCGATDATDRVQVSVTGSSATSTLEIPLTSPTVASINFVSASPPTIYLKGSGLTETSSVVFRVLDTAGNGLPNRSVILEPTTLTGGLTLDGGSQAVTRLSDSAGNVSVLINSGTVPTPVRVKATLAGSAITTVSSGLSIAVGLPAQLNFSLSQQTQNIEGFNIDGTANTYSIIASDRLGNPVPVDTAINFVAEAGQIEATRQTALVNGLSRASVNFVSSSPRPSDGRVTVVAYAIGEESFLDTNGNNVFNAGEPYQDLGNVYLNRLFNGRYDPAQDQFIALSLPGSLAGNQACAAPSTPLLAGSVSIPSQPLTCDAQWGRAYVRRAVETVFSTSGGRALWAAAPIGQLFSLSATCPAVDLGVRYDSAGNLQSARFYTVGGSRLYGVSRSGVVSFIVADTNPLRLNPMAAGTAISASATNGLSVSVAGGTPVPSTTEASFVSLNYSFEDGTNDGVITVSFTSPSGTTTSVSQAVSRLAAPSGLTNCP